MTQYHVLIAEDDEMPAGQDWLLIEHTGGVLLVLREGARLDQTLADSWAGGRHLAALRGERYVPPLAV